MPTIIRHLLLLSAVVVVVQLATAAAEPAEARATPKTNITIAKDTTRATGPLTDDGYLDYAGAINQRLGKGVTPETNANVLFWKALGPHPEDTTVAPKFFKLMEIPAPNEDGAYFLDLTRYLTLVANIKPDDPQWNKIVEQQRRTQARPWTLEQYPQIAAWLKANEGPLTLVVQGTRRTKYYSPLVVPHGKSVEDNTLIGAPSTALQQFRSWAQPVLHAVSASRDSTYLLTGRWVEKLDLVWHLVEVVSHFYW